MIRRIITTILIGGAGGTLFIVSALTGGTVTQQTNEATDAGIVANRDCTCPVRLDPDYALDAGLGLYQRLTFPCSRRVQSDGGIDMTLPPMPKQKTRDAIDVVDWNDCSMAASTGPVAALWGTSKPFVQAATKPWCRQRTDAGLACLLLDGGSFGDRNVSPCSTRANPATCERVSSGVIYLGDSEDDL